MKGKRLLRHEALESRRLLAAEITADVQGILEHSLPTDDLADHDHRLAFEDYSVALPGIVRPDIFPGLGNGPDLIQEVGNRLFVVDQIGFGDNSSTLFVLERMDDDTLTTVAEVAVEMRVNRMVVQGESVVLLGNNFQWRSLAGDTVDDASISLSPDIAPLPRFSDTQAVTVHLSDEVKVTRQVLEGFTHTIHQTENGLVVISTIPSEVTIAIFPPPPPTGIVTTYKITDEGLVSTASTKIPLLGLTAVNGNDFYVASVKPSDIVFFAPELDPNIDPTTVGIRPPDEPVPPTASIARYHLAEGAITEVATVELGLGFITHFEVFADGQNGVVVLNQFAGSGPSTLVNLLDFSGDPGDASDNSGDASDGGVQVVDSIRLDDFQGHVVHADSEYIVLRNWRDNTLVVIDANPLIDVSSEGRVRRIEIPPTLHLDSRALRLGEDRLVFAARRVPPIVDDPEPALATQVASNQVFIDASGLTIAEPIGRSIVVTVSLRKARIIGDAVLPDGLETTLYQPLILIDTANERFGLLVRGSTSTNSRPQFLFGQLDAEGDFQPEGSLPLGPWLEVDANANRLIIREEFRILEYDWNNLDHPIITPLGDGPPPIEAINDEYKLVADGDDALLEVLANDVLGHAERWTRVEIVELIGAPEGAEIVHGRAIRIPGEALKGVDNLRFQYVISNGVQTSTAVVEIDVISISEDKIKELVDAIIRQAADDFDVAVEDIQITSVERIFDQPLPIVRPNDPVHLDLSPGILVLLTTPNATAMYAASLDGQIIQVFAWRREYLAELGLRAVDQDGAPIEEIREGDEFWLEFNARDLREAGLGVYAAFFDLEVPTEHLTITGPVEIGDGFIQIPGGEFNERMIDDLGAISNELEAPRTEVQRILRIGVRAVGAGEVTIRPGVAADLGHETLLFGRDEEVPSERVRYRSLTLHILPEETGDPLDADGNGTVSAADVLIVINFLGRHGAVSLDELGTVSLSRTGEGEPITGDELEAMRRLDTNRSGTITALDALVIINNLTKNAANSEASKAEEEDVRLLDAEQQGIQTIQKPQKI